MDCLNEGMDLLSLMRSWNFVLVWCQGMDLLSLGSSKNQAAGDENANSLLGDLTTATLCITNHSRNCLEIPPADTCHSIYQPLYIKEETMEARLDSANKVLNSTIMKKVPKKILKSCKGIAILQGVEFALGITGGGCAGVLVKHNEDGSWGPQVSIMMTFVGVGADLGIVDKSVLLVPMTDGALKTLTGDTKVKLGAELGIALCK